MWREKKTVLATAISSMPRPITSWVIPTKLFTADLRHEPV